MRRRFWLNFILVLVGIVIGTLVAQLTANIPGLSWLAYSVSFGTSSPLAVDLRVVSFTLGATVNISISVIIFVALSVILGKLIARK